MLGKDSKYQKQLSIFHLQDMFSLRISCGSHYIYIEISKNLGKLFKKIQSFCSAASDEE